MPAPQALLVNGLSMSEIATHQVSYYDLVYQMKEKFEDWSPAIFIGYNSINFDEEFLRNALFQNLHENAYLTQINNNGRADALNIVQASSIFTPTAIKIPDNKNKFKLDLLAPLNNIEHENAHDALADVIATIEICKLIKKNDAEFWDQSLQSCTKRGVSEIFEKIEQQVFIPSYSFKKDPHASVLGVKANRDEGFLEQLRQAGQQQIKDIADFEIQDGEVWNKRIELYEPSMEKVCDYIFREGAKIYNNYEYSYHQNWEHKKLWPPSKVARI